MPQYDCPMESVYMYLPATTFTVLGNVQCQRAICILKKMLESRCLDIMDEDGETGAVKSYV